MKVSKIFGCVLSLHLCVIVVLLVQPGCQTGQPPTQTQAQKRATTPSVADATATTTAPASETRRAERRGLDDAFNTGLASETIEPTDWSESIEPLEPLEPISTERAGPTAESDYQSYTVKRGDSLWAIARRYGVSVNELYAANNLTENSVIREGQQIQIPVEAGSAPVRTETSQASPPSTSEQATTSYTVQRGDSLSRIANRFDTTVNALKAANNKSSDLIRVGETLVVPGGGTAAAATTTSPTTQSTATTTRSAATPSGATQTHTVKAGEYPGQIARQYGMTANELLALNNISDPRRLRIGQELMVTGSEAGASADRQTQAAAAQPTPRTTTTPTTPTPTTPAPAPVVAQPGEIRIIEADPLIEGELDASELDASELDDMFEDATEIPVIRLEE